MTGWRRLVFYACGVAGIVALEMTGHHHLYGSVWGLALTGCMIVVAVVLEATVRRKG